MDAVVGELPAPIRQFIADGSARAAAKGIMEKYQLHIDQGGVVEREILLLLIGMRDPAQFVQELTVEGGLDAKTVSAISEDVNAQIFVPLREKMRGQGGAEAAKPVSQATVQPVAPKPPVPSAPAMPKPVAPAPRVMPEPPANLPGVMMPKVPAPKPVFAASFAPNAAPMNAPAMPKPPAPAQTPQRAGLAGALKAAGVPLTSPLTSQGTALLEDHEEPHIDFKKPVAPPPAPAPRVLPTTMPPVQTMPVAPAMPKPPAPSIPTIPMQSAVAPQRPPMPQQPPVKSYAVDPYREQPDETEK